MNGHVNPRGVTGALAMTALLLACGSDEGGDEIEPGVGERPLPRLEAAAVPPPPVSGGTLAVKADASVAVAADPDRDLVYVVDLDAWAVRATVRVEGGEPGRVVLGAAYGYVALRRGGEVLRVDLASGDSTRLEVCPAPRGLALDGERLHVACAGGELVTLRAADGEVERRVFLDTDLRDVVVTGGRLHVSRFRSAELLTVDDAGEVVDRRRPRDDDHLLFGGPRRASNVAWRTVGLADGRVVMLHQRADLAPVRVEQPGGYGGGGISRCGSIVGVALSQFEPDGPVLRLGRLPVAVLGVDVSVRADGGHAAVATPGSATNGASVQAANLDPGRIDSLCLFDALDNGDGFGREVTAVARDGRDRIYMQSREPAVLARAGRAPLRLSSDSRFDTGHDLFHADAGAGIACASCHPEGQDDGHVWLFDSFGLRRTQGLTGGIAGSEPFHWEGDMADFTELAHEVMGKRMGGPHLPAPYASALLDWIDAQPLPPDPVRVDDAAVGRGRTLFDDPSVGCASCHVGGAGSDNVSHDVGTGGVFQTPSLRGVKWRPPFLHDGCAASLAGRFDAACGGGEAHGRVSHLSAGDLGDLVTYLETL